MIGDNEYRKNSGIREAILQSFIETSVPHIDPNLQMPKLLKIILECFKGDEIYYFDTRKYTLKINSEFGETIFRPAYHIQPSWDNPEKNIFHYKKNVWKDNNEIFRSGKYLFLNIQDKNSKELYIPVVIQEELIGLLNIGFINSTLTIDKSMEEYFQIFASILANYFERYSIKNQSRIFENAIQQSKDVVLITDSDLSPPGPRIIYANEALRIMTGYTKKDVIGNTPRIFQGPNTDQRTKALMKDKLKNGEPFSGTVVNYKKDRSEYYVQVDIHPIRNAYGNITNFIAIERDITNEIAREKSFNKRLKYEIALASVSQLLLQPYNNKNIISESLEQIHLFSGVSSISILISNNDTSLKIFKSFNPLVTKMDEETLTIPQLWLPSLKENNPIIAYEHHYDLHSEEELFFRNLAIHSCLIFPIQTSNKENGTKYLFITEKDIDRIWQDEDILLFRTFCHLIGAFLERMSYLEELFTHRDRLQDIVNEKTLDLEIALQKAEVANQAKTDFLSNMSHELRTPLNSIIGFTKLIRVQDDNPDYKKYLEYINKSGNHLLQLINEILDMSKIESGTLEIRSEKFSLIPCLKLAIESLIPQAEKKNIQFQANLQENPIFIKGDEKRLRQVFLNILSNAVKFSYEKTDIIINIELKNQNNPREVWIKILNMGYVIPNSDIERIFEKFTQLKNNSNLEQQGTGLGLSISKLLTESMGGKITAESFSEGRTTFTVILPLYSEQ